MRNAGKLDPQHFKDVAGAANVVHAELLKEQKAASKKGKGKATAKKASVRVERDSEWLADGAAGEYDDFM